MSEHNPFAPFDEDEAKPKKKAEAKSDDDSGEPKKASKKAAKKAATKSDENEELIPGTGIEAKNDAEKAEEAEGTVTKVADADGGE